MTVYVLNYVLKISSKIKLLLVYMYPVLLVYMSKFVMQAIGSENYENNNFSIRVQVQTSGLGFF